METSPAPAPPNSTEVGHRIGVTRSAVSRFRNGSRLPRMATRQAIAREYGWPIEAQATAEASGTWAESFERVLCGHLAS